MNSPFRFALIGTGAIADIHANVIDQLDNSRLVAVASSSPERAKAAEKKFEVPAFSDYETMMDETKPDIVCVCTKSGAHLEPVKAAASRGIHVITEKPLEINMARASEMIEVCRKAQVKLACVFQNRFANDYLLLKNAVTNKALGQIFMGNAYIKWFRDAGYYSSSNWKGTLKGDGGGALINQGIHTIDLLIDLLGEPVNVHGQIATKLHPIEGEDVGMAMLNFKNGAMGTIQASTAFYPGYPERLEIFGDKGSIIFEQGKIIAWNVQGTEMPEKDASETKGGSSNPMAIGFDNHLKQFRDFLSAISENREPIVNGEEGLKALKTVLAIFESSKSGSTVYLN